MGIRPKRKFKKTIFNQDIADDNIGIVTNNNVHSDNNDNNNNNDNNDNNNNDNNDNNENSEWI